MQTIKVELLEKGKSVDVWKAKQAETLIQLEAEKEKHKTVTEEM